MATDAPPHAPPAPGPRGLISERAYRELRDRIVRLELPPGTVLREGGLMAELGIGRTPLREAIKRLEAERLVEVQPRRGTSVTGVDAADIVAISEVRAALEGFAAGLAAVRLSHGRRDALLDLRDELAGPSAGRSQDEWIRLDERVHRLVWDASGNPYLVRTLDAYFALSLRVWYLVLDRVPGLGVSVHDQLGVLDAVLARDQQRAREAMRAHVLEFQMEIVGAFSRP